MEITTVKPVYNSHPWELCPGDCNIQVSFELCWKLMNNVYIWKYSNHSIYILLTIIINSNNYHCVKKYCSTVLPSSVKIKEIKSNLGIETNQWKLVPI